MTNDILKQIPQTYDIKESGYVEEMHADVVRLEHKKTRARVLLVCNDDTNKVFNIAFRTPVYNSCGVPHIIEHTVLCGSREFPSKDPFVELVKGSLNTFLNAMTYPDKTMYPVASYNDKDFQNLMHVYLDAVFYPNIYKTKRIFEQEGWHYELKSPEDALTINGVVYNEMKGAFSSPDDVLNDEITKALFPDTTYSYVSGGDPDDIPNLTYEEYLDFHRTYYHPSNSYIYLYGDFDVREKLTFLDEAYLSDFEYKKVDSEITRQAAFEKPVRCEKTYAVSSDSDTEDKTWFSYNVMAGDCLDSEKTIAFKMLDYVLLNAPGAILKKALLDQEIGKDVFGSYDVDICQPYLSIVAKDADPAKEKAFMDTIRQTLQKIVDEGISKRSLEGALNNIEFKFREADYGRYPKGLMYGLTMFDSWLYQDDAPLTHVKLFDTFKSLREKIKTDYFERLIDSYILNNPHAALVVLHPSKGLAAAKDEALAAKLSDLKAGLTAEEIEGLVRETQALIDFQEAPSTEEELEKIPMISTRDITKEAFKSKNEMVSAYGMPLLWHDIETNGIHYFKAMFKADDLSNELLPYVGLLNAVLGCMDTKHFAYNDLTDEINMHTGGISTGFKIYYISDSEDYKAWFSFSGKALGEKSEQLCRLMQEVIFCTDFSDKKRLGEIISQTRSRCSMALNAAGHSAAVLRAFSYIDPVSVMRDLTSGIGFYDFIADLDDHFDEKADETIRILEMLCRHLFKKENAFFDFTAAKNEIERILPQIKTFEPYYFTEDFAPLKFRFEPERKNEAFITSGMVQFNAAVGNFKHKGFNYHGALPILRQLMDYEYLWQNIRVKGGAYGCMADFGDNGMSYFVTYRDPNLKESYDIFKAAGEYLRHFDCSDRDMEKYIIGTIGSIDTPLTPADQGERSLFCYMSQTPDSLIQMRRDELLNANAATIRGFADLVDAFVGENYICVVGSENKIKANEALFVKVRPLE